nr:hypothetical protein CFP56_20629 [Quercus suber]
MLSGRLLEFVIPGSNALCQWSGSSHLGFPSLEDDDQSFMYHVYDLLPHRANASVEMRSSDRPINSSA